MRDFMSDLLRITVRWVMWSRRHFMVATLSVLAIVALLGVVTSGNSRPNAMVPEPVVIPATVVESGPGATLTEAPSGGTSSSSQTNSLTNSPVATSSPSGPHTDTAVVKVADAFTRAWVNRGQSATTWRAEMTPYATSRLLMSFSKTDPSTVPVNIVTGRPVIIGAADGNVAVRVPVNGGLWVQLVVTHLTGGWLVSQVNDVGAG